MNLQKIDPFIYLTFFSLLLVMSKVSPGVSATQHNGLQSSAQYPSLNSTQQELDPVVSFSPEGVGPSVNIVPPPSDGLKDYSAVTT